MATQPLTTNQFQQPNVHIDPFSGKDYSKLFDVGAIFRNIPQRTAPSTTPNLNLIPTQYPNLKPTTSLSDIKYMNLQKYVKQLQHQLYGPKDDDDGGFDPMSPLNVIDPGNPITGLGALF